MLIPATGISSWLGWLDLRLPFVGCLAAVLGVGALPVAFVERVERPI